MVTITWKILNKYLETLFQHEKKSYKIPIIFTLQNTSQIQDMSNNTELNNKISIIQEL